jgi:hypothetical protein
VLYYVFLTSDATKCARNIFLILLNKSSLCVFSSYEDGECDLSFYKDDSRVGDSIRFSKDRKQAFLILENSSSSKALSLEKAAQVAKEMGTVVAI